MTAATTARTVTVALIGNPNTGKSTLFNALVGMRQRVGNYPGVTVEKKLGRLQHAGRQFSVVDLPGTYSLAPRSPDEMIAVDVLLGRRSDVPPPDVVVCIVDASNLERNLYLVSQVLELGRPTILALNMLDMADGKGVTVDPALLASRLQMRVVGMQAHKGQGIDELKKALAAAVDARPAPTKSPFPDAFQREVAALEESLDGDGKPRLPRYLVERLLLDTSGYLASAHLPGVDERITAQVRQARQRLAEAGLPVPGVEAIARYEWAGQVIDGAVNRKAERRTSPGDRLDRVLTHRLWGSLILLAVLTVLFQAVFFVAEPASAFMDWLKGLAAGLVEAHLAEGALRSLVVGGMIEGVGGVLVFLPQIFVLFLFIAILEDCGYMARAAYLMDRLMSRVGLSGKSFIPLLSSFACAVPGIMSARSIEHPRDRLVTILIAPLMSCSARLPVYALLIRAFIPNVRFGPLGLIGLWGLTLLAMYLVGIVTAVFVSLVLRKTILRGPTPPFVMELPSYKFPGLRIVLYRMFERGWAFVRRAGTIIFAVAVVVWAAAYFPHDEALLDPALVARRDQLQQQLQTLDDKESNAATDGAMVEESDSDAGDPPLLSGDQEPAGEIERLTEELAAANNDIQAELLATSYLGRAGKWIEPAVRPLGWDWRVGCAAIASFPAREVVVATLGVIYHMGEGQDEKSPGLHSALKSATWEGTDRPVFNVPVALSLMVFFALCAQCASTLAVMKRETNSWRWPIFAFVYMTTLAYLAAMATYQIGMLFVT